MRAVLAVLGMVVVVAGCSSGGGRPNDTPATSAAAPIRAADDPIPPVLHPKSQITVQPCLLLSQAQLDIHRINQPGTPKNALGNTGCNWTDKAGTREFVVYVDLGNDVLHNVYSERENIPVFEVTDVAGLPAIRTKDDVNGTSCYYRVATSESQTLIVRFTSLRQAHEDPCPPAKHFAETIINNLSPATG